MSEPWTVNGHRPDCAYFRSLRADQPDECDCRDDLDDDVNDVIDDEMYGGGDYGW